MSEKNDKKGTPAIVEKKGNVTVYKCGKNAGKEKTIPVKEKADGGSK